LKNGKMVGYFIAKQTSPFYQSEAFTRTLNFLRTHPHTAKMKEANNKLTITFDRVTSVGEALKKINAVIG
jgi:transcription-repair coupling factor (superfamily II helicase)